MDLGGDWILFAQTLVRVSCRLKALAPVAGVKKKGLGCLVTKSTNGLNPGKFGQLF
jgi:hypothetical protein